MRSFMAIRLGRRMRLAAVAALAATAFLLIAGGREASAQPVGPTGYTLLLLPDLRVTDLALQQVAGQWRIRIEVKNTGTAKAGLYKVSIGSPGPFGGVWEWFIDYNGLDAGSTQYFYHDLSACTPGALMWVAAKAEVDPGNHIAELSEANNTRDESWFFYC